MEAVADMAEDHNDDDDDGYDSCCCSAQDRYKRIHPQVYRS